MTKVKSLEDKGSWQHTHTHTPTLPHTQSIGEVENFEGVRGDGGSGSITLIKFVTTNANTTET